jgi:hypothetical protein
MQFLQDRRRRDAEPDVPNLSVRLEAPFFRVWSTWIVTHYQGYRRRDEDHAIVAINGWLEYPIGADGCFGFIVVLAWNPATTTIYHQELAPLPFGDWERLNEAVRHYLANATPQTIAEVGYWFCDAVERAFGKQPGAILRELGDALRSLVNLRYLRQRRDPEEERLIKWKMRHAAHPRKRHAGF